MIYLTWIRPTAETIHLWNYFWAIKPMFDYAKENNNLENTYIFIADLHWLIWNNNLKDYKKQIINQYSIFKAIWFKKIFLQSDILEITQIEKYLNSFINLGKLQRMHSIKNLLNQNKKFWDLKLDLFNYPVLMTADIVWIWANKVFLGLDQKQHLEVTKEIILKVNNKLKTNLVIPEGIFPNFQEVIWLDWRKMSKSYNNYIDPFANEKKLLKQVNSIITDNTPLWEEKDFDNCNIIKILQLFKTGEIEALMKEKYKNWSIWYGEAKKVLYESILTHFKDIRKQRDIFLNKNWKQIKKELEFNWKEVQKIYQKNLFDIKDKIFS